MRANLIYIFACLLFISFPIMASLPKDERVPGGVAVIELPKKFQHSQHPPQVTFEDQKVALIPYRKNNQSKWYAVVGIPLTMSPGLASITIRQGQYNDIVRFKVVHKKYPEERLQFKNKQHVAPDPKTQARIKHENEHLKKMYDSWTLKKIEGFSLKKPVKGRTSSSFGKRRLMNNQLRSIHKGLDIAAKTGTPVVAARLGKVQDIGDYFYTGNTVMIDHGQGFKTLYCHLHTVNVKEGELVETGQKIGTVGMTGRATGPHLHFGVNLNGERVSPSLFFVN